MIYYLSLKQDIPFKDYWDYTFLYFLFGEMEYEEVRELPNEEFGVVVINAKGHSDLIDLVNKEINKLGKVVLFLMSDEELLFPIDNIKHNNIKIWIQYAHPEKHKDKGYRKLINGPTPHINKFAKEKPPKKTLNYFFAGQITHSRREEMVEALEGKKGGNLIKTFGFAQGISNEGYVQNICDAKVVPCPSGPVIPETFRLYEALEVGAVPITDNETPTKDWTGFWEWLFEEPVPFPTINKYSDLSGYIDDCVDKYPTLNNRVQAWWLRYKNKVKRQFEDDIGKKTDITAVVPISPIKSHPDISIIEETIDSVLYHLPKSEIFLTFDGVRSEQEDMSSNYEESIRRVLWKYRKERIIPYVFDEHLHQIGMMRAIIDNIETPTLLYVEQDTPLVTDYDIPFYQLFKKIDKGISNLIRFSFEAHILDEHKHLMIGEVENDLLKTVQWSQRPHLASTAYYDRIINNYFSKQANCFIEDKMHSIVLEDFYKYGLQGWQQHKLHIYHPKEENIKRSYHTDARQGGTKFDNLQLW